MSDIQQARDVLAKWRAGATKDSWWIDGAVGGHAEVSAGHVGWEVISGRQEANAIPPVSIADATLIVGTAGNPELLNAIDSMFATYLAAHSIGPTYRRDTERLAAAIIAVDERMTR